uniref:Uncharacterized protein n=1 Tax=Tetranychus urticae TaxID=32264 RepID=T1KUT1_TETUR
MFPDRFYPAFHANYPPNYKPPSMVRNKPNAQQSGPLIGARRSSLEPVKSVFNGVINFLTWIIYMWNIISIISLGFIVYYYIVESQDIQDGKLKIPAESKAEVTMKQSEIDYDSIRMAAVTWTRIMLAAITLIVVVSDLLLVIGCYYESFCLTFLPCVLLLVPLIATILDIHWTQMVWYKILLITINTVNCCLSYIYSCMIKQKEYKSLFLNG